MMVRSTPDIDGPDRSLAPDETAVPRTGQPASTADVRMPQPRAPEPLDQHYGDPIDQASDDSFPASDPPPWTLGLRRVPVAGQRAGKP